MPREEGIRAMLSKSKEFEAALFVLLGRDYNGSFADRAPYPTSDSLEGVDGSFILLRLKGPMWQELKQSIDAISRIADKVFADTPGKAAFDWITRAVNWIDELHSSVSLSPLIEQSERSLVLSKESAKDLLRKGQEILLDVPDDLRRTLSQHKIYVSTTKDGRLRVKPSKGSAHHAAGVVAIRWCPILFESLQADVNEVEEWESSLELSLQEFRAWFQGETGNKADEAKVDELFVLRDTVDDLLLEVANLVVSPPRDTLEAAKRLRASLQDYVGQLRPNATISFSASKFGRDSSVVRDRHLLLDALVSRLSLDTTGAHSSNLDLDKVANQQALGFRTKARLLFDKALRSGATRIGITSKVDDEVTAWCSIKAFEIETAIYDQFQSNISSTRMTTQYRDKARTLKRSIEDNITLCTKILGQVIQATSLVEMSVEDLASQRTKQLRAKAEKKQNFMLIEPVVVSQTSRKFDISAARQGEESSSLNAIGGIMTAKEESSTVVPAKGRLEDDDLSPKEDVKPNCSPTVHQANENERPHFDFDGAPFMDTQEQPSNAISGTVQKQQRVAPPPPPPSLAAGIRTPSSSSSSNTSSTKVSNNCGSDHFRVSAAEGSYQFEVCFYQEGSTSSGDVDNMMPEKLTETRRTHLESFIQFVREKMKSGRYDILLLRMVPDHSASARYRAFYKEYESRNRIATFNIQSDKLFLVTPKFQRHLRGCGVVFEKATTTYGLVLAKKERI